MKQIYRLILSLPPPQMNPTKEEMIDYIQSIVADKTLSFGCRFITLNDNEIHTDNWKWIYNTDCVYYDIGWKSEPIDMWNYEILWHPVRPHHILIRWIKNWEFIAIEWLDECFIFIWSHHTWYSRYLEKPLSEQPEETISEIFNLVKEVEEWK